MADYEQLIAQLKSITDNPTRLDGDTQKRILEATKSCSTKLRTRPPLEQISVVNQSSVQTIDPLLLQGSVTVPLECDRLPGNHENPTNDPRTLGFNEQSTETLSPSSGLYDIPHNLESLDYSSMEWSFDPQQVQDSQTSTIFNDPSSDWSTSFSAFFPYMTDFVPHQATDLMSTAYDPIPLDLTTDTFNDFVTPIPLGFRNETNIEPVNMDHRLTTNTLRNVHSASYWNDIGPNVWRLAPSPMDQSYAGSNQLNHWPTRSDIIIDSSILEEPSGRDPFSLGEGLPTPGDIQRPALQGTTTPDVSLGPSSFNTAPTLLAVTTSSSCDLPRDCQQELGRELRATKQSSLSMHSVVSKPNQKENKVSSRRKPKSPEERRKTAERRRIGACYRCSRGREKVSLTSYYQLWILPKHLAL